MKLRGIAFVALTLVLGLLASTTAANAAESTINADLSAQSKPCGEIRTHPVLSRGDSGSAVRHAQCLIRHGFNLGIRIDGDFGPRTYDYVKQVQHTCRIDGDGIIGTDTWVCLHSRN